MDFKSNVAKALCPSLVLGSVLLAACGSTSLPRTIGMQPRTVGTLPAQVSLVGKDDSNFVLTDSPSHRLLSFAADPFRLTAAMPLPFDGPNQSVLSGPGGNYFIIVAGSNYAIVQKDGTAVKNPANLPTQITGVSFDPSAGLLLLIDDTLGSAVVTLDGNGTVKSTWLGNLASGGVIKAGTLLPEGKLFLKLSTGQAVTADVRASMSAKAWTFTPVSVPLKDGVPTVSFDSFAAVEGNPDLIAVHSASKVFTYSLSSQSIVDSKDVAADTLCVFSPEGGLHALLQSPAEVQNGVLELLTIAADGHLRVTNLTAPLWFGALNNVASSRLDVGQGNVSLVWTQAVPTWPGSPVDTQVFRYSSTDGTLLDMTNIGHAEDVFLTKDFLFLKTPSALGAVERRVYGKEPGTVALKNFNFDALARRNERGELSP